MSNKKLGYRVYGKLKTQRRFQPFDFTNGRFVTRLINATVVEPEKYQELKEEVDFMNRNNPDYTFVIRKI